MKQKYKIFLGGCYSGTEEKRVRVAQYGAQINELIKKCGYEPSLNLLGNKGVFKGAKAENVSFENGKYFLEIGEKVIKKSEEQMRQVRGLRDFASDDEFTICYMAANIADQELSQSMAGIFELSEVSQGSYMEIGLLAYHYLRPVLCLRHESWGRPFGTMLTGSRSIMLQTRAYNDSNLDQIVKDFLTKDLTTKKSRLIAYRLPAIQDERIKIAAKQEGFETISDLVREALDRYLNEVLK